MTGAEVDALRLPLKKKLAALADLPAHIVLFRRHLAQLNGEGILHLCWMGFKIAHVVDFLC
jgi:hypothetical protein